MKSKIILGVTVIISTFATAMAAPISHTKIKQLIKKTVEDPNTQHKTLAGMDTGIRQGGSSCRNAIVKKISIHKIGKTSTRDYRAINSYEDSRKVFTNQGFDVTFSVEGSCELTFPAYVLRYQDIRKNGGHYKRIFKGRVPLRKTPLTTHISRDSFYQNIWGDDSQHRIVNDDETEKEREAYRIKLYKRMGKNRLCRDIKDSTTSRYDVKVIRCTVISMKGEKKQAQTKSKMSFDAETGLKQIKYDRIYTPEVKALLLSQPKSTREFIFSTYWKLSKRRNHAKSDKFIRDVITQLKSKTVGSKAPKKSGLKRD